MGRNKPNKSLIQQVKETLDSKLAIGNSKYQAKRNNTYTQCIYSWETYRSYLKHCCHFVRWCKEQPVNDVPGHKPRTIEECRAFVERWIQYEIDRDLSAHTIKLEASALAKLYGCRTTDFNVKTPARRRKNITRSRGVAARDKNFSIENHKELITFCRCTGLRRAELKQIRGTDLIVQDGQLCLDIRRGTKGGRPRVSPIVGSEEEIKIVKKLCMEAGNKKVFPNPSNDADIHSFRADYAKKVYGLYAREYGKFKNERLIVFKNRVVDSYTTKNGRRDENKFHYLYTDLDGRKPMLPGYKDVSAAYYCRDDLKGTVYDRRALFAASRALGHNREQVVASNYLYV